jgi:hypothetical protein
VSLAVPMAAADEVRGRLSAAADRLDEAKQALDAAFEQRDAAVVDAIDRAGMAQGIVAKLARVSQPHITRILGKATA